MLSGEAGILDRTLHEQTALQEPGRRGESGRIHALGRLAGLTASDMPEKTDHVEPSWVGDVIHFWFEDLGPAHWFAKSDETDVHIRDRFLRLHEQLAVQDGLGVCTPRSILAAVIVLDQFSRNLFRADARAFSADHVARRLSRAAIAQGFDTRLKDKREKYFLYLPFEHSEDRTDQALAHSLIQQLDHEPWTRYATAHMTIIGRFGRFPHRNAVLKRVSTADEVAFLSEPTRLF
jgi:uncharacterized protein (DUF924 family)